MNTMLPKQYRLKNKKAFDATYKNRKVVSNSMLTIYLGREKKDASTPTKIGFVVSKKYHKRAVKRNRIKRLMRETCRLALKGHSLANLNKYMSFIVIPKDTALSAKFVDVQTSFYKLLERIR